GSKLLKEEIETFNPIKIQGLPRWISSSEKKTQSTDQIWLYSFTIENEEKKTRNPEAKKRYQLQVQLLR
ncbi:uncharacterized protein K441DRAFT_729735, partial [Cenococcum geophilum 1.58]|uniref:uncharacterized protein n=1 Tax=Cenococcum geophilum 1.58 TaxID=794803 RepID=UPI00358F41E1